MASAKILALSLRRLSSINSSGLCSLTSSPGKMGPKASTLSNIPSDYTSGTKLTTAADVTFTNVYNAAGIAEVTAKKVLVGNRKLNAGDFRFELKRMDNDTVLQATNDASGNIKFPSIPFASGSFP